MDFFTQNTTLSIVLIILGVYLLSSITTYIFYWRDKRIARRNSRRLKPQQRISEKTLHTLEMLGGWPGAFLAQRVIRHKNDKRPYQVVFWSIVAIHLVLWAIGIGLGVFVF